MGQAGEVPSKKSLQSTLRVSGQSQNREVLTLSSVSGVGGGFTSRDLAQHSVLNRVWRVQGLVRTENQGLLALRPQHRWFLNCTEKAAGKRAQSLRHGIWTKGTDLRSNKNYFIFTLSEIQNFNFLCIYITL